MDHCDVVVIGLGGMGAAALAHLARRGLHTIGVELHDVPHSLGSSHGGSRVIRKAYYEDPRYVPLLERSYDLWRDLEAESGQALLQLTGALNLGRHDHPHIAGVLASARQHGLEHEMLTAPTLRTRFPAFRVADDVVGVHERDGGILAPERCTAAHVTVARKHGADVRTHTRVSRVDTSGTGVVITTDAGPIAARQAVLALGPWWPEGGVLAELDPLVRALRVTRQVQCWFAPTAAHHAPGAFPVFIQFLDDGRNYYGMPPFDGHGVKVCRHGDGPATSPAGVDRVTRAEDADDVRRFLRTSLPDLDGPLQSSAVCLYTMSPDGHFVVGRAPGLDNVVVLGGFSGHGYKMAPVIGEIAAELVVDGRTGHDIALFDPARLSS